MENYYCNFNLYQSKRRRMSIFGRKIDGNQLEIIAFPCSKNDSFSKKEAREIYQKILDGTPHLNEWHEEVPFKHERVVISYEEKPKKAFIDWCVANYKRRIFVRMKEVPMYITIKPGVTVDKSFEAKKAELRVV